MENYNLNDQSSAPFNMAIATLMRIDAILKEITKVSADPYAPANIKQATKVTLVKQLFIQASPLLKPDVVKKHEEVINNLKAKEQEIISGRGGIARKSEKKVIFDYNLDLVLDKLCLEIQRELQNEKYFMPPRKDLSRAITEM